MSKLAPQKKVAAGGLAGSVSVLVVFIGAQLGVEVPGEVGASIATLVMFVAAYFKSN